jgi:hypothetical protein
VVGVTDHDNRFSRHVQGFDQLPAAGSLARRIVIAQIVGGLSLFFNLSLC